MKWSRLVQPRNPLFWLMVMLNVLSSGFAWAMRALSLNTFGMVLFGGLALANALLGLWLAWRLVRGES